MSELATNLCSVQEAVPPLEGTGCPQQVTGWQVEGTIVKRFQFPTFVRLSSL